ncbi:LuxR C-terminal-related transcriptional regulator [Streptomyces sp. NPDC050704]|uniref:helix-turn-helix transcriptional regulator n=1 Tax=Streptomyces sp. NPDC050704 TaxID=3157219 RepID=UPI003420B743
MVREILRQTLVELPPSHRSVRLTGRFATETVTRPDSDLSRFVRTEVLGRGHGLRLLLTESTSLEPGVRPRLARITAEGAEIRVSSGTLPGLALLATELAIADTKPGRDRQPQVLVVRREATTALCRFQQTLWDEAAELVRPRHADLSVRLDPAKSQVLRMLGSGMKDDTAARQMNVSVRTYRRHVAAILRSLGVNTRFEAGLRAAELGLLDADRSTRQVPAAGGGFPPDLLFEDAC